MNNLAENLRALLKSHIVHFTYLKKDGTIREAVGTRNLNIARSCGHDVPQPKGEEKPNSYYDFDKEGWRSFIPANVISIDLVLDAPHTPAPKGGREIPILNDPYKGMTPREVLRQSEPDIDKRIKESWGKLGEAIDIFGGIPDTPIAPAPKGEPDNFDLGKIGRAVGVGVGKPIKGRDGIGLPIHGVSGGDITIEDFAKLIAKHVVAEIAGKISR